MQQTQREPDQSPLGQSLSPARQLAVNDVQKLRVSATQLLTGHKLWATLDYSSIQNPDVQGNLEWTAERAGTGHGFVVWFDAELVKGIGFSNAPGVPETIYGSFFFPWTRPVPLKQGQTVCVDLAAKLVEKDYLWRWTTRIEPLEVSGASPIHFDQSQFCWSGPVRLGERDSPEARSGGARTVGLSQKPQLPGVPLGGSPDRCGFMLMRFTKTQGK